jgi:hypothetical protein
LPCKYLALRGVLYSVNSLKFVPLIGEVFLRSLVPYILISVHKMTQVNVCTSCRPPCYSVGRCLCTGRVPQCTSSNNTCILKHQQDRQCMHNINLRRVRVTTVTVENKYYIPLCVCVVCVRAGKCVCVLARACVVVDARTRECTWARVALLSMQRSATLSSAASLAVPHFFDIIS